MKRLSNLALVLAIGALSASVFGAATTGMLRSNGGVSVNGAPVTPVTTVFAGDRIETAPQAGGNITVGGSSLSLTENSSLLFNGENMDFQCGGGTIQTTQGMAARYGHTMVKPAKDAARYRVQQTGASLQITAVDGDLTLTEGGRDFTLAAGKSASVAYNGCAPQMAKADLTDAAPRSVDSPAPQPGMDPAPPNQPLTKAAWIAPGAVTTVGVVGIIEVKQNPASPNRP
jgi:hypothetical protein